MDITFLITYIRVVIKELWQHRFLCLVGFAAISFSVLVVGMAWPSKFETSATIFADNQNILKPLLHNQAAQSEVQNQTRVVRDMIHSPRILKRVVDTVYGENSFRSAEDLGQKINELRAKLSIFGVGSNYIKISYSDSTPDEAYKVINATVDVFIKTSSEEQRSESREAFQFIDNQVKQYKDQLVRAEERLKNFRSQNFDGRDGDVNASIRKLRDQIEELKITIDEDKTSISVLESQLKNESEYSSKKFKANVYIERLEDLETQMNTLLLTYTEDYPDVVSLKYQIDDIKRAIRESEETRASSKNNDDDELIANPLYQELRSKVSTLKTGVKAKNKRLLALDGLLENEYERRRRIAERGAEESELTRDYNVTKKIYEDMLERKEKARLSMTLNVEGQGVTYRIQEPALPPLNPVGLRFMHFVAIGPILGALLIFGLFVVFVFMDKRIRFPDDLSGLEVPVLAHIPRARTELTNRKLKIDIFVYFFLGLVILSAYAGLAFASKLGLI